MTTKPDHPALAAALRALERASRMAYMLETPNAATAPPIEEIKNEVHAAEDYLKAFTRSLG
jgi:hypothetical protein